MAAGDHSDLVAVASLESEAGYEALGFDFDSVFGGRACRRQEDRDKESERSQGQVDAARARASGADHGKWTLHSRSREWLGQNRAAK